MAIMKKLLVIDIEDYREIFCEGDKYRAARELKRLTESGLVRAAAHPDDGRKRCLVLTLKGAREVGLDVETSRQVIKKGQLGWGIAKSKLYFRIGQAGIPANNLLSRKEALEKYNLSPNKTALSWVIEEPGPYILYVPWKARYKAGISRSINQTEEKTPIFKGHVLVHETMERWRQDRRRFLYDPPPGQFYLLTYEHLYLLNKTPAERREEVGQIFQAIAPGGKLVRTPPGAPLEMAYNRKGEMLVGDMRMEDITLAARVLNLTNDRLQGWNGVTLVMRDESQIKEWARLFGRRDKFWYITESTLSLYRYDVRKIQRVGGKHHERLAQ